MWAAGSGLCHHTGHLIHTRGSQRTVSRIRVLRNQTFKQLNKLFDDKVEMIFTKAVCLLSKALDPDTYFTKKKKKKEQNRWLEKNSLLCVDFM